MKRLEEIIDVNTEGNYLFSSTDKAKMMSEILDLFSVVGQREQLKSFADWLQSRIWDDKHEDFSDYVQEYIESL